MPISSGAGGFITPRFKPHPSPEPAPRGLPPEARRPSPPRGRPRPARQGRHGDGPRDNGRMYEDDGCCSQGCCYGDPEPCCCFCGGSALYSTGITGAGAGLYQGGMFSGRKYPLNDDEQPYELQASGRRRCCAFTCAAIFIGLLVGCILGIVFGVLPYVQAQRNQNQIQQLYPGGFLVNGVYYLPVTNSPDTFYLLFGPGIPCNPYNNNSNIPAPTASYDTVTEDVTAGTPDTYTVYITDPAVVTLPNCEDITTAIQPATGQYNPPRAATVDPQSLIPSSASPLEVSRTIIPIVCLGLMAVLSIIL